MRQVKFVSAVSTSEFHEQIKNLKNKSPQMKDTNVFIFSAHNFTAINGEMCSHHLIFSANDNDFNDIFEKSISSV